MPVFVSPSVFCQAMIQCPACLPNVCWWALAAGDAVHHPFHLLLWDRVFRMDQLLFESPKVPQRVQQSLQKNGYPAAFITRHSLPQPVPRNEEQTARASVTIPYIHGLSKSIRRVLSPLAIKVTFQRFQTLQQELVHLKDPVPEKQRKGVVYSIPCGECPPTYATLLD